MTAQKKSRQARKRGNKHLLRRRVLVTVLLIFIAGFATLSAFVWTRDSQADVAFDPYFPLNTGSPKVRIFQPLHKSLDNKANLVANGQAPAGSTVTIQVDGNPVGTTTANDKGLWSRNLTGIADGDHQITASATVPGPLAAITSDELAPGYGLLDLSNDTLVSSRTVGISTGLRALADDGAISVEHVIHPDNSQYVYFVRQRSITVLDTATQQPLKTIYLGSRFLDENGQDTGEQLKTAITAVNQSRIYLLFSSGSSGKVLAVDTASNILVEQSSFNPAIQPNAQTMVRGGNYIYVGQPGQPDLYVVDTTTGNVSTLSLETNIFSLAAAPDGSVVYAAEGGGGNFTISLINPGDNSVQSQVIDLGTNFPADTMRVSPDGQRLFLLSYFTSEVRVINLADNSFAPTIMLSATPQTDSNSKIAFNADNTRAYIPQQDHRIAIVDVGSGAVVGSINPPSSSYNQLKDVMYYGGKIYAAYSKDFDVSLIFDLSQLYNSIAVANGNGSGNIAAQPLASAATTTSSIVGPIAIAPQTYTGTAEFSVGKPLAITSPAPNAVLSTSTPLIKGTGPKNKTVQLVIGTGSPANVPVDSSGNWQAQVTLPKDAFSKITVLYNNKRTQLVIPNHTIFGKNVARTQMAIIDGESSLEQQAISLADTSIQNLRINNSAAINPNGQRYYLVSTDVSSMLNTLMTIISDPYGSYGGYDEYGMPSEVEQILAELMNTSLGVVTVYSAQTRQQVATVPMPNGVVPIGLSVSPDGKKAVISTFSIPTLLSLISGQEPVDESAPSPVQLYRMNLEGESNTLDPTPIVFNLNLAGFNEETIEGVMPSILSSASALQYISKPGSFSADGSKFYTSALAPGSLGVVDMTSGQKSTLDLPSQYANAIVLSTQLNKNTGVLYATYLSLSIPTENNPIPQFSPGILIINTQTGSLIGQSLLPNLPLFNFAVSSSGAQLYFVTANITDFITALTSTDVNVQGILAETLPQFSLAVYDLGGGTYTEHPLTSTEIPMALTLAPDNSKVFIPTLAGNIVHVFDTATGEVNPGNAPVVLGGLSLMFGTADYIGETIIGSYDDNRNYYVPADAPVDPPVEPRDPVIQQNNVGVTQFRYLPAAQQASFVPQPITVPQRTAEIITETVQQAVEQQRQAQAQKMQRNWLIYLFYALLMMTLTAIGVTVWRTDMLLGKTVTEDVFA